MEKTIGKPKKVKTKSGRAGSFFLGTFIGFLLTIALLAGLFSFVYFKVSPNWINKHFKTNIDLPYDLNSMTISDVVSGAINLSKNLDKYTLKDLEKDFGVKLNDKIYKINISQLKNISFSKLADEIMDRFGNISAYELAGIITLPSNIDDILSETTTYYVQNNTLYKEEAHTTAVEFPYTIENDKVVLKNFETVERTIIDNQVAIELKVLPLKIAFAEITDSISSDITVGDLREKYNISLPDYLEDSVKVTEIASAIQELEIGKILGINSSTSSGIMAKIASAKVSELNAEFINTLTVKDIFPEMFTEGGDKGVLGLIEETTYLPDIPTAISTKIKTATLDDLNDAGLLGENVTFVDKYIITELGTIPSDNKYTRVGDLTIIDLMTALENNKLLSNSDPTRT